ncbi:DNA-binding GntR family transcriptional regulator [Murinocardiopsis flavida]|uniref:DNA-binding GntR family transcriptional regulator n=2 Tax=Murinocardiopsis flavida TaxID=645275 RepID=A0A2P8DUN8_9ACTN|nr:DNA-binding GntR family transcriptional regulator [Murinocardiopsis flavida]
MGGLDSVGPMKAQGTADLIADLLRERILDGVLAAGEQINEVHLAARLEMSRGPVREAVQRLVQEGLLTSVRNRGTSVVQLGIEDIADVYRARLAVEREAARVVFTGDHVRLAAALERVLGDMRVALDNRVWADVSRADLTFHQTIVDAAGSRRMSKMFGTLVVETLLCIHKFENIYDPPDIILDHHRRLADLLRAGDLDDYLREIDWHLQNSVQTISAADPAP